MTDHSFDELSGAAVRPDSLVLIDLGEGSRVLVAADSPLGHPFVGARAGQRVRLRTAGGPRLARVLAVQSRPDQSRPDPTVPAPRAWPLDPFHRCPSLVLMGPNRP